MTESFPFRSVRLLAAAAALLLLAGCAQTSLVDDWRSPDALPKPAKVAVVAVLPEALMREAVEVDVTKLLVKKGTPAVASSRIPGMGGGIRGEIDAEAATGLLRAADVDGVIVMFYSGGGNSEGYVRSDYWAEFVGSGTSYYWGRPYFTGFTDVYVVHKGPGYADYKSYAFVESSYYDLASQKPAWRIVTETKDIEHADVALDIAEKIASEMRSAKLN